MFNDIIMSSNTDRVVYVTLNRVIMNALQFYHRRLLN